METSSKKFKTIDEYIATFPIDVRKRLKQIRQTIKEIAPEARETIRYQMPAFIWHGYLVHFAAWKNHIAMYAAPSGSEAFNRELSRYRSTKSTIQFPLDKPLPLALIRRIVKYRVKENLERNKRRKDSSKKQSEH